MQVKKMWAKENHAILVWPGEEPLTLAYNAISIVVPPRDIIGRVGGGSRWTHEAAELAGKKLPGTAVIKDVVTLTAEGGYQTILNIDHVCRYFTKERDDLFLQGFNIVEMPEEVREAMTLGVPLYAESQDLRARGVLAREMARQKAYKDRGENAPPALGSNLITWALKHLQGRPQQQAHRIEDIEAVLQGRAPEPAAAPQAPSDADVAAWADEHDRAIDVAEAGRIFAEAEAVGVSLGHMELQALLRGSAETIRKIRVKIEAKKVEQAVA